MSKHQMDDQAHDLDSLAAFVEGRLDEHERQRVMQHASECVDCRRTLAQLARAMADGSLAPAGRRARAPGSRWSTARVWLPIAASVLVGTFAWFQFAASPDLGRQRSDVPSGQPGEITPETAPSDQDLLRRRSGGRTVGDKTFRFATGEWVDASFDPAASLPIVVIRGAEERRTLLAREPRLASYTELGDRVIVVWQGTVYHFQP